VPIYDYVCGSCGHRFEVFRGINEAGPSQCPECGGPVARAIVAPTIHFKGSGWAKSDRRAMSTPSRRADAAAPASGSSGSSESSPVDRSGPPTESAGPTAGADATSSAGSVTPATSTPSDADR
jgi:putative FmdB family regulatory protein